MCMKKFFERIRMTDFREQVRIDIKAYKAIIEAGSVSRSLARAAGYIFPIDKTENRDDIISSLVNKVKDHDEKKYGYDDELYVLYFKSFHLIEYGVRGTSELAKLMLATVSKVADGSLKLVENTGGNQKESAHYDLFVAIFKQAMSNSYRTEYDRTKGLSSAMKDFFIAVLKLWSPAMFEPVLELAKSRDFSVNPQILKLVETQKEFDDFLDANQYAFYPNKTGLSSLKKLSDVSYVAHKTAERVIQEFKNIDNRVISDIFSKCLEDSIKELFSKEEKQSKRKRDVSEMTAYQSHGLMRHEQASGASKNEDDLDPKGHDDKRFKKEV